MMDSTYFLCFILVVWLFIARNTVKGYRNIVIEKLHDYKEKKSTKNAFDIGDSIFEKGLNEGTAIKLDTFEFLRKYNPSLLLPHLGKMMRNQSSAVKELAFELVETTKLRQFQKDITALDSNQEFKKKIDLLKSDFNNLDNQKTAQVLNAINSNDVHQQLLAINSFGQLKADDISYLSE